MKAKHLLIASALVAGAFATSLAQAHAKLKSAEPKADSVLDAAPKTIHLQFNTNLEPAFSKIALTDAKDAEVALPKTEVGQDNSMSSAVPPLQPGLYHVKWSTMTRDGHKVKGEYQFTVK